MGAVANTNAVQLRAAGGAIVSAIARVNRLTAVMAGGDAAAAYVAFASGAARIARAFRWYEYGVRRMLWVSLMASFTRAVVVVAACRCVVLRCAPKSRKCVTIGMVVCGRVQ